MFLAVLVTYILDMLMTAVQACGTLHNQPATQSRRRRQNTVFYAIW